jgi:DNA polymerase elongation subunit (family B)
MIDCSLPIAETTIVLGARYLTMAKDLIQERYSDVVDVVYGDTDSVFLRTVQSLSVPEAIEYISSGNVTNSDSVIRSQRPSVRSFQTRSS